MKITVLFRKKININDDHFLINKNKILWADVRWIEEVNNRFARQLSYYVPYIKIFLRDGKVIRLSHLEEYESQNISMVEENDGYSFFVRQIKNRI